MKLLKANSIKIKIKFNKGQEIILAINTDFCEFCKVAEKTTKFSSEETEYKSLEVLRLYDIHIILEGRTTSFRVMLDLPSMFINTV